MKSFFPYIFGALLFVAAVVLTDATFWGDSADYVDSVIAFQRGRDYYFWEFGHLFWRPLAWFVWTQVFFSTENSLWRNEITSIFQYFSYIAGLGSTLILVGILKELKLAAWIIAVTTVSFVFSHAFLNFTQTATPYTPALTFYLLGLFFSLRSGDKRNFLNSVLSGICLALTLCFWMPFLWTIPAVIVTPLVLYGYNRQRLIDGISNIGAFSLTIFLFYGIVLAVLQIDSLSELKTWITAASHGNETNGLMRMIFGLGRSFVNMGSDGILFKRFLLNDPFNPVSFITLTTGSLWKIAAFYALVLGVLFLLLQNSTGKRILILLSIAGLPLLGFSVLFDGGAVERYLPLFPLAFISLAMALYGEKWKLLRAGIPLILATFIFVNIYALSVWVIARQQKKIVSRVELLETKMRPEDTVFLVNWNDDLVNFNRSFPFHPINLNGGLRFNVAATPGTNQTKRWREEFAFRSLWSWENGKNVWLSSRAFEEMPKADWNWTEGDDKNVRWHEFPEFFGRLEIGDRLGDVNGFVLILPSEVNKSFLKEHKDRLIEQIYF